jgi:hypothetical protein
MIELLPAKRCDEISRCGGSAWAGVVINNQKSPAKHATSLILDGATQLFKCVATGTRVDGVLRHEVHKQNALAMVG